MESIISIIDLIFKDSFNELDEEEKLVVNKSGLIDHVKSKLDTILDYSTPNYRQIKNTIEDLINSLLVAELLSKVDDN